MKKRLIITIVASLVLAVLLGTAACSGTGGTGGLIRQQVAVTRGDLTVSVSGNGKVETSREARLTFGSAGKIGKIMVKEGDKVKTGDILAKLDTRALELSLKQAQMSLTQAESTLLQAQLAQRSAENSLENLKNSGSTLKLALLNAQIARDTARINLNYSITATNFTQLEADLNRTKAYYDFVLRQSGSSDAWRLALDRAQEALDVAQRAYDNAIAGYDSNQVNLKKLQLEAAELSMVLAQKNIDDLGKNVTLQELQVTSAAQTAKQAQQAVELARQSVADAQKQLDETTVTAPFEGMVASVFVKEGDIIPSPSMVATPIVYIVVPNSLELVIEVDEIDIPSVKMAQEAEIKVDALPGTVYRGRVAAIYPVPVEKGGIVLYKVKVTLDVPDGSGIKIGMSASADIVGERHANVLIVPSRAVTENSAGKSVVKVPAGKETQEKEVVTGLDDGMRTEIVSGLSEGETVVVEVKTKSSSGASFSFGG